LKKKNKNEIGLTFLFPRGPAQPDGPLTRPHARSHSPERPSTAAQPARAHSPVLSHWQADPTCHHLPPLSRSLPRAHSPSRGGRPVTGASVDQLNRPTPTTPSHDSILLICPTVRAPVTLHRRRWRLGNYGDRRLDDTKVQSLNYLAREHQGRTTITEAWSVEVERHWRRLVTVAGLNRDGGDPRWKTMVPRWSWAVASTPRGATGSQGDGGAIGEMEMDAVEQGGRIWPEQWGRWRRRWWNRTATVAVSVPFIALWSKEAAREREAVPVVAVAGWKVVEAASATSAARRRPCRALPVRDSPVHCSCSPPTFEIPNCFLKLLSKSCNNLKNFQSMKSSEFQALQVLYWTLFQILTGFWNLNLNSKGDTFFRFGNLEITFDFTLKLQNLQTSKLYILTRPTTLLFKTFSNSASILKS
jgi:hypothetical protein